MKNTLLTAGGAILTIQGIELAKINEGSLSSIYNCSICNCLN